MRAEPLARLNSVLIDYAQHTKAHVLGIVVVVKGKRVAGIKPTVIASSTLVCRSFFDHPGTSFLCSCRLIRCKKYSRQLSGPVIVPLAGAPRRTTAICRCRARFP